MKLTYTTIYEDEHALTLDKETTLGFIMGLGLSLFFLACSFV